MTTVMREDAERESEKELMRFKMMAIAMHPKHAKKIMAIGREEDQPLRELTEEEMENYTPIQQQPDVKKQIMADLRSMGLAVIDD